MADTMVDTTDILDMDMLTTDKQIKTQTSILKDEKKIVIKQNSTKKLLPPDNVFKIIQKIENIQF